MDAQKVSTHNHRANIAERIIETAKHHFIAGMAVTDENYPIREWDRVVSRSQRTLNMLRPCRINPKLLVDAFLEGQNDYNSVPSPPLVWQMLIFEGPDQRSSWGFHGVEGFSVGPAEENYSCYRICIPTTGAERISDTVVFFPPRRYTYDLPAPPTQEEVEQEAEKYLGDSLRTLATNNPTYTHLSNFSGLQKMSDFVNSAAKKDSDAKTQEIQRVTPPRIPGGKRVGTNIIEDDREDAAQQIRDAIREKEERDYHPENSNVVGDKTYNRPLGRATHRYPTRNVIQQVHKQPTE